MKIVLMSSLAAVALASSACARVSPPHFIDASAQECVDGALRRDPDRTVLPEAAERFQAGCAAGDPAACSLLGLMHERGLSLRPDLEAARALYQRACDAGNNLGCVHLHRAELALAFSMSAQSNLGARR